MKIIITMKINVEAELPLEYEEVFNGELLNKSEKEEMLMEIGNLAVMDIEKAFSEAQDENDTTTIEVVSTEVKLEEKNND